MQAIITDIAQKIKAIHTIGDAKKVYIYSGEVKIEIIQGARAVFVDVSPNIIGYGASDRNHSIEFSSLGDLRVTLYRLDPAIKNALQETIEHYEQLIYQTKRELNHDPIRRVNYDAHSDEFFMMNGEMLRVIATYPGSILCESLEKSHNFTYNSLLSHGAFYCDAPKEWLRDLAC